MYQLSWKTYLSWSYLVRMIVVISGLFLYALGIVLTYRSGIGLDPWDVFHQGISKHTPLTFGTANIAVGAILIGLSLFLKVYPGVGTLLNMLLIGSFVDLIIRLNLISDPGNIPFLLRLLIDVLGVAVIGLGTALYISPRLGAGPRDGLMVRLQEITKIRVSLVRAAIEITVLVLGYLLGGTVGIGTLLFALGIGPAVEASFYLIKRLQKYLRL
ncbi:YczE/YyaS/YitT family protein [Tengunoibacter tsumagoiensis]|uniref:Membrane protein n=1 Tax=Tengunoibacter tsumagoiensis TaxID=2014871 RepID=A0A402A7T8_9CHLR|nr:hypothetical protein [Tengunoibacter tsumagoiensis]GCE15240.1 membrane protein [Tengunoibacter tsumagoiensis]